MIEYEDAELVRKACRGEPGAFDALVQKYWEWAFAIAYGLTDDPWAAQDIAQEAFTSSWQKVHQLTRPERFKQWLRRIVMNQTMMYLRKRKLDVPLEEMEDTAALHSEEPVERIIREENVNLVNGAMQALALRHRLLLTLFYIDGLSHRDISALLEISEPLVKSRLYDARTKLRKEIAMEDLREENRETVISLRGVSLGPLEEDSPGLKNTDLDVKEGEFLVVVGPQYCGKYEALRVIGLLERPDSGIVEINGVDMSALDPFKFVETKIGIFGYIWMQPQLSHQMNAVENVILPLISAGVQRSSCVEKSVYVFRFVGLEDEKRKVAVRQLSVLDQQRVSLARALISDPMVIIAEEPTGNMTVAEGREFADLLKRANEERNITIVCASHDLKMMQIADRLVWMHDGEIVKIGVPGEGIPFTKKARRICRYPATLCEGLSYNISHNRNYTETQIEMFREAAEKHEQAVQKATVLRGEPGDTDEELIRLQINEFQESIELLSDAISILEEVFESRA